MADKEKKLIDSIDEIIENFGSSILDYFEDSELIDAVRHTDILFDYLTVEEIIDYLEERGYSVKQTDNENLDKLCEVCCNLKPKSCIDKEEAKKLVCDYLDAWMDRCFYYI